MDYSLYFVKSSLNNPTSQFDFPKQGWDIHRWVIFQLFHESWKDENENIIDQSDYKAKYIISFLDYHFDNYVKNGGDKDQFLMCIRQIKLSVLSCVESKKNTLDFALKRNDFYKPLYLLYAPIIEKWILQYENKIRVPDSIQKAFQKEYKSLMRARAFCILILIEKKKLDKQILGKTALIGEVKRLFPSQSGKTVYDEIQRHGLNIKDGSIKYPEDYNYGLKLAEQFI
jgi:hypothetical protein